MRIALLIFILSVTSAFAQEVGVEYQRNDKGEIVKVSDLKSDSIENSKQINFDRVHVDPKLKLLLEKRNAYHQQNPYVEGYRVQLRNSTSMEELMAIRSNFLEMFPNEFVIIEENLPYFLLRVGNYVGVWGIWKAKLHAELLKRYFDRAVYVRTSIFVDDLLEKEADND